MITPAQQHFEHTQLVTIPEAARTLSISKRTLERLIAAGQFPRPLKIGRASRVALDDIKIYLDHLRHGRASVGAKQ
jgi:excisionase family DNA binding protein